MAPSPDLARHLLQPALRYFAVVARVGSFRAAARELNVASSAVNRQILGLEEALSVALFERIGKRLRLSPAGELLAVEAERMARQLAAAGAQIDGLAGLERGRVRIATIESVGEELLPAVISGFQAGFPGIELIVTIASSAEVTERILRGEADLGLTFLVGDTAGLEILFERDLEVGAVVANDHPLAGRGAVGLAECLAFPLVLPMRGLSIRHAIEETAAYRAAIPKIGLEANTLDMLKAVARKGEVVAFQTRVGLSADLERGELCFVPLADHDLMPDRFALVQRRDARPFAAVRALLDRLLLELPRLMPKR